MKVGIIGGGASGMMAAIVAARNGAQVSLMEKNDRIGKKILATGNGKCNFTNKNIARTDYISQNKDIYCDYISQFNEKQVLLFFKKEGMLVKEKNGYYYPRSEQASTILDIFRKGLDEEGVDIVLNCHPVSIKYDGKGFTVLLSDGEKLKFDRLILACGSFAGDRKREGPDGYTYAKKLGHTIVPVVPALVQLRGGGRDFKSIAGVRCEAIIRLILDGSEVACEEGELQLTDYGISGIPVFQLSRFAAYGKLNNSKLSAIIDFLPEYSKEEWKKIVQEKLQKCDSTVSSEEFFLGFLNKKLNILFIKLAGMKPDASIKEYSYSQVLKACMAMKRWEIELEGTNPYENAQVCAGGVSMEEINLHMESKLVKGLFFAGEMVDVDGRCGGYNLQWAWTSGYLAGRYAALNE